MSPPFPAYIGNLTLITAGYALFQVANATVVMQGSGRDNRGVTAALLGRSRNLGLITGASAMAALFAAGLHRDELMDMMTASEAGLLSAFAVAAALAGLAFCVTVS